MKPDIMITYKQMGGHVHCQMYTSMDGHNWTKNGELVFEVQEWVAVRGRFQQINITVVEDQ